VFASFGFILLSQYLAQGGCSCVSAVALLNERFYGGKGAWYPCARLLDFGCMPLSPRFERFIAYTRVPAQHGLAMRAEVPARSFHSKIHADLDEGTVEMVSFV
jgi:hypothetical protein